MTLISLGYGKAIERQETILTLVVEVLLNLLVGLVNERLVVELDLVRSRVQLHEEGRVLLIVDGRLVFAVWS